MKNALILGCIMISVMAHAEVVEFMGRRMEVDKDYMNVSGPLGQVFGLEQGKTYLKTGNDEIGTISSEKVGDDTIRFGIGGQTVDIKQDPSDPNTVLFLDSNGNVVRKITKTVDANGNDVVLFKDVNDVVTSRITNDSASGDFGVVNEMFPNGQALNMQIENGEVVSGSANLIGKKYKKDMHINKGNVEMIIKDAKSNKQLYKMQGNDNYMRVYDAAGKLIAEGADEDNAKVYNQKAFEDFQRIMEDDDD